MIITKEALSRNQYPKSESYKSSVPSVLYELNCQHLLHSFNTNCAQSKTLALPDLFLNGGGHLFCDFLMSVIYYHHASVLKFRQMTSKVFNISKLSIVWPFIDGKNKYILFPNFPVIIIYSDPRPFWLIGYLVTIS